MGWFSTYLKPLLLHLYRPSCYVCSEFGGYRSLLEFSRIGSGFLYCTAYRYTDIQTHSFCKTLFYDLRELQNGYYHFNLNCDFFYDHFTFLYSIWCDKVKTVGKTTDLLQCSFTLYTIELICLLLISIVSLLW